MKLCDGVSRAGEEVMGKPVDRIPKMVEILKAEWETRRKSDILLFVSKEWNFAEIDEGS